MNKNKIMFFMNEKEKEFLYKDIKIDKILTNHFNKFGDFTIKRSPYENSFSYYIKTKKVFNKNWASILKIRIADHPNRRSAGLKKINILSKSSEYKGILIKYDFIFDDLENIDFSKINEKINDFNFFKNGSLEDIMFMKKFLKKQIN